jgi:hypothetical protein
LSITRTPEAIVLVAVQAVDEVMTGNIPVDTEDDVAELACEAMYVDLQDELPETEDVSNAVT